MNEVAEQKRYGIWVLKSLLASYVLTGVLLLILAGLLYKFDLDEKKISIGIIVIYVMATVFGGFVLGKCVKLKRFMWGFVLGFLYFAFLLIVTLLIYRNLENGEILTSFLLCIGGGMLGGMLS